MLKTTDFTRDKEPRRIVELPGCVDRLHNVVAGDDDDDDDSIAAKQR